MRRLLRRPKLAFIFIHPQPALRFAGLDTLVNGAEGERLPPCRSLDLKPSLVDQHLPVHVQRISLVRHGAEGRVPLLAHADGVAERLGPDHPA